MPSFSPYSYQQPSPYATQYYSTPMHETTGGAGSYGTWNNLGAASQLGLSDGGAGYLAGGPSYYMHETTGGAGSYGTWNDLGATAQLGLSNGGAGYLAGGPSNVIHEQTGGAGSYEVWQVLNAVAVLGFANGGNGFLIGAPYSGVTTGMPLANTNQYLGQVGIYPYAANWPGTYHPQMGMGGYGVAQPYGQQQMLAPMYMPQMMQYAPTGYAMQNPAMMGYGGAPYPYPPVGYTQYPPQPQYMPYQQATPGYANLQLGNVNMNNFLAGMGIGAPTPQAAAIPANIPLGNNFDFGNFFNAMGIGGQTAAIPPAAANDGALNNFLTDMGVGGKTEAAPMLDHAALLGLNNTAKTNNNNTLLNDLGTFFGGGEVKNNGGTGGLAPIGNDNILGDALLGHINSPIPTGGLIGAPDDGPHHQNGGGGGKGALENMSTISTLGIGGGLIGAPDDGPHHQNGGGGGKGALSNMSTISTLGLGGGLIGAPDDGPHHQNGGGGGKGALDNMSTISTLGLGGGLVGSPDDGAHHQNGGGGGKGALDNMATISNLGLGGGAAKSKNDTKQPEKTENTKQTDKKEKAKAPETQEKKIQKAISFNLNPKVVELNTSSKEEKKLSITG